MATSLVENKLKLNEIKESIEKLLKDLIERSPRTVEALKHFLENGQVMNSLDKYDRDLLQKFKHNDSKKIEKKIKILEDKIKSLKIEKKIKEILYGITANN